MIAENKRLFIILATIILLLLVPFIAMQFTGEIKWSGSDFLIMGALLSGTGLGCELILRKVRTPKYRIIICSLILIMLVLIWLELAVGIFGTPFAGS